MKIKIHEMSYSGLNEYLICPMKFYYSKITKAQPEFTPVPLAFGSGIHVAAHAFYQSVKKGKPLPVAVLKNIMRNCLEDPSIKFEEESKDDLIALGEQLYQLLVTRPVGKILGIEKPIEVPINERFSVIGTIDLLTEENGEIVLDDFKSVKRRPSLSDMEQNMQLTTYSCAEPKARLRITALLKQKTPKLESFETKRGEKARTRLKKTFLSVKNSIESNCFFPKESWACASCQFQKRCHKDF